jgi:hypothetical protein
MDPLTSRMQGMSTVYRFMVARSVSFGSSSRPGITKQVCFSGFWILSRSVNQDEKHITALGFLIAYHQFLKLPALMDQELNTPFNESSDVSL